MFLDCAFDREYLFSKVIYTEYGMYPEIEGREKMGSRVGKSSCGGGAGELRPPVSWPQPMGALVPCSLLTPGGGRCYQAF